MVKTQDFLVRKERLCLACRVNCTITWERRDLGKRILELPDGRSARMPNVCGTEEIRESLALSDTSLKAVTGIVLEVQLQKDEFAHFIYRRIGRFDTSLLINLLMEVIELPLNCTQVCDGSQRMCALIPCRLNVRFMPAVRLQWCRWLFVER